MGRAVQRADHARETPPSRAQALRTDSDPQPRRITWADLGPGRAGPMHPLPAPYSSLPWAVPDSPHGRARVQGSPAGSRQGCEQTK